MASDKPWKLIASMAIWLQLQTFMAGFLYNEVTILVTSLCIVDCVAGSLVALTASLDPNSKPEERFSIKKWPKSLIKWTAWMITLFLAYYAESFAVGKSCYDTVWLLLTCVRGGVAFHIGSSISDNLGKILHVPWLSKISTLMDKATNKVVDVGIEKAEDALGLGEEEENAKV